MSTYRLKISNRNSKVAPAWIDLDDNNPLSCEIEEAAIEAGLSNVDDDGEADDDFYIVDSQGFTGLLPATAEIDDAITLVNALEEHGLEIIKHVLDCTDVDGMANYIRDNMQGTYSNAAEFAEDFLTDCGDLNGVSDLIRNNIHWYGVADELQHDYVFIEDGNVVHVFRNS